MRRERLPNYLRGARKGLGLTQRELSYLLGVETGGQVSRYEQFERMPSLSKALALEAVLGTPIRDLFAGAYEDARERTASRASMLVSKLEKASTSATARLKLATVRNIAGGNKRNNSTS